LAHNLPLIQRVRVSFVTPPKIGVSVKPLTTHSFDIAHMPIIASLIEHTLTSAVESTVVTVSTDAKAIFMPRCRSQAVLQLLSL
jgi:Ca2+-dependent lipid-binding protein